MPAKPLSEDQLRDASRLRSAYELWIAARKEMELPATQDVVADLFGMGQSALSQYLNGKIPLNAEALHRFATVFGVRASLISPSLVKQQRLLAAALEAEPNEAPPAERYFKPSTPAPSASLQQPVAHDGDLPNPVATGAQR